MSKDAEYLEQHGWTRIIGIRKFASGGFKAPVYWRDPDPNSLEPMMPQGLAVQEQKRRGRNDTN